MPFKSLMSEGLLPVITGLLGISLGVGGAVVTLENKADKIDVRENSAAIEVLSAKVLKKDEFYRYMDQFKRELKEDFNRKVDK